MMLDKMSVSLKKTNNSLTIACPITLKKFRDAGKEKLITDTNDADHSLFN